MKGLFFYVLQDSQHLRRQEVSQAATAINIPFEEKVYSKVMKELCTSHGSVWTLKTQGGEK